MIGTKYKLLYHSERFAIGNLCGKGHKSLSKVKKERQKLLAQSFITKPECTL